LAVETRVQPDSVHVALSPPRLFRVAGDYLALLKPRIILLLILTELGTMIAAARGWPHPAILAGSLLGGALASGGAGAINCWFDRDIDAVMPRTRRRPIPAGRISPGTGLAFGVVTTIAGLALIAISSNLLAAGLAAAGALLYVFVYTMWLKRSTTQNIVIGGAAGAIPPLVGWAAVTGSLSPLAWSLFAIVFFWTPPHFWALALVLRRQYSAVGIPMLPAVAGPERTRRAILRYTAMMLFVSFLPAIWLGAAYGAVAIALGVAFLGFALRALRRQDGRAAMDLFYYSLAYLALLFAATAFVGAMSL
jgi:protoheme IX farnesyltransferase